MVDQATGPSGRGYASSRPPEYETEEFVANAAILSGNPVMQDLTANPTGRLIVPTTGTSFHRVRGLYTGIGGTGAYNPTYGGRDAVAGDVLTIVTTGYGLLARVESTSAIAAGNLLTGNNNAELIFNAATTGVKSAFSALEASSGAGVTPRLVRVDC